MGEGLEDLSDELAWLRKVDSINIDEGIKNNGGAFPFSYSLKIFYETIDDHCKVIEKAFEDKDYKLYVIKVHALKASARIIGATKLSELAADLEKAGKQKDYEYIVLNHDALVKEYRAYSERLAPIADVAFEGDVMQENTEEISAIDLKESYEAIERFAKEMDYDAIDAIIKKLKEYEMPSEDQKIIGDIEKALKLFDWKRIEELINL